MAMHSESLGKIIAWAKIAKKIYVPLQGSGGASVQVNRRDFLDLLRNLENFDGHATFGDNCNLYMGG
ncbi:MAG: hypothetical protein V4563_17905 [Pseudomonadota bacterium]